MGSYDPLLRQVRRRDTSGSGIGAGGPVGDSTHVAQITWNSRGELTVVTSVAIAASGASGFEPFLLMGA